MSLAANCPNCGAPVRFRWSSAVQTVCEFCRSILVRRDVNLERVGTVADLPEFGSPIQIGTEGNYRNRAFTVIGRILYEYEQGGWNEWHLMFQDGVSGWLSDAQLQYAVSFLVKPPAPLPAVQALAVNQVHRWNNIEYQVTTLTNAHYRGVQGELPFEYWDKQDVLFADLATREMLFATLDYSEGAPLLFMGEWVEFEQLKLQNLRQFEGW